MSPFTNFNELGTYGQAVGRWIKACAVQGQPIVNFLRASDAARDIESVRQALGEDQVSVYAAQYWSAVAAIYATLYPSQTRALVLDTPMDPSSLIRYQPETVERLSAEVDRFLADCTATNCPFSGKGGAEGRLDYQWTFLRGGRIPAPDGNGALAVSDYGSRVAWGVSLKSRWPALAAALDGLDRNDPAPFKLLGAFNPLLSPIQTDGPGFYGIACRNGLLPTTPEAAAAMTSEFSANRTRLRLWYAFRDVGPCVELGFRAEPLPPVRSLTTIPPLILRRDNPTVPAIWADRVAATLVPSFVVKLASDLTCAFDASGDYLVNLRRPTTEVCS